MAAKSNKHAWLSSSVKIIIALGIMVAIVWRLGWREILTTVSHAHWSWLLAALVVFIVSGALGVWQWQIILHNRKIPLSFGRAFMLYFIGLFFNTMSFGMVAGDAVKITYLKFGDNKGKAGFAATFLDRFAGLWTMLGFAVVGCLFLIKQKAVESSSMTLTIIGLFCMFIIFGGIAFFLFSSRLQAIVYAIIDALPLPRKAMIEGVFRETLLEAHDIHIILPVALISIAVQMLRVGVHICCGLALGLLTQANISYFFILVPVTAMLMVLPLPFGVRESVGGALFAYAGFPLQAAIVMGFLASLAGIAGSCVGGILFVFDKTHFTRKKA